MVQSGEIEAFITVLTERRQAYVNNVKAIRKKSSVDLVHDFRVATRRLLMIEPLLRIHGEVCDWRKPSKQLLQQLNQLRDLQVLYERFRDNKSLARQLKKDLKREEKNWPLFIKLLNRNFSKGRLRDSFNDYIEYISGHNEVLPEMLEARWQAIHHDMNSYLSTVEHEGLYWLHRLRVSYKLVRYFAELLIDAGLMDGIDTAELKYWQDTLGDIQDVHIAINRLEQYRDTQKLRDELYYSAQLMSAKFWEGRGRLSDLANRLDAGVQMIVKPG